MSKDNLQMVERCSPPTEIEAMEQYSVCYCSDTSVWVQIAPEDETTKWIEFHSVSEAFNFIEKKRKP